MRLALSHANGDSNSYSYSNIYAYARTNSYGYSNIYAYARTNSYGYSNVYAYARTNGNGYSYCYCDGDSYANAHSDTLHVARGPERASRNQRDFQQLYRELEQRQRCDRLSVGRLYKQHFHHLPTWLPGFGCRKRDQRFGTGLSANTTYFYRVRAYNGCATSRNSNVKNLKTLPCTPAAPTHKTQLM